MKDFYPNRSPAPDAHDRHLASLARRAVVALTRPALTLVSAVCCAHLAMGLARAEWLADEQAAQWRQVGQLIAEAGKDPARASTVAAQTLRPEALIRPTDRDPLDVLLRRTRALLVALRRQPDGPGLVREEDALIALEAEGQRIAPAAVDARRAAFGQTFALRRRIALANPLLGFGRLILVKRPCLAGNEDAGNHMCQQYYGFNVAKTGGLFVIDGVLSDQPVARDLLADAVCGNGRFAGTRLPPGGYLSPELSYDGRTVYFAYTQAEPLKYQWTETTTYHLFRVGVDGRGLTQLTDGPYNDFDPCCLPNGRIAFISERRGGYGRCHPSPKPSYTLHSMFDDGGDIVCLSYHESNEWQPSVAHDGRLIYTRWDYVDRGAFQAHSPWVTMPDGRDARALTANYGDAWQNRPLMTMHLRAIPGSTRYVATAAAHHGQAYGSLVMVDAGVKDDFAMSPYKRLTPDALFPESEPGNHTMYGAAWPLSEEFYLCVYDGDGRMERGPANNFGVYLVDVFGNRELLYRDAALSCLSPVPLKPRVTPPVVPHATAVGRPSSAAAAGTNPRATIGLVNVYDSQNPWPANTRITALRIIQVLPKTTWKESSPRIGHGFQKGARAVLGSVPVESDGSAWFIAPPDMPLYFQALDDQGLAVQTMRSDTYVHPGEQLVCGGCHESRLTAPVTTTRSPLAFQREPSRIAPEVDGSRPFSYPRLVQPVLDRNCVACHARDPKAPDLTAGDWAGQPDGWYTSYVNLKPFAHFFDSLLWNEPRTVPGAFGARASGLLRHLASGHHDLKLSAEDLHRLTLWLDCNSDFYGAYEDTAAQSRGEEVWPELQ